jgi:hypothetical protein
LRTKCQEKETKKEEVRGEWRKLHNDKPYEYVSSFSIGNFNKSERIQRRDIDSSWKKYEYKLLIGTCERRSH